MIFSLEIILFGTALFGILATLSWIDIKSFRLPNKFTFPLMGLGLLEGAIAGQLRDRLIGLVVGYCAFLAIEYGFKALRGKDGLGRGDAKLLAAGGAWCGWMGLPFIVLIASGAGLAAALSPSVRKSADAERIAFGPFLALGIFMVWVANAYIQMSG
ncbi:A24 family peptidase [Hellea sp.]|nr:A24 family peptidase [Hellea sp.]